jgi:7-cyano-7-deazaguanine synthase in queuosine biosynthesis
MPSSNLKKENSLTAVLLKKSTNPAMNFLKDKNLWLERDILTVANVVFNLEKLIKLGQTPSKVTIPLSYETRSVIDLARLKTELEDLILNVLIEDIEIEFSRDTHQYRGNYKKTVFEHQDTVCLFSGGVDSYAGLLSWNEKFGSVAGVTVIHGDQPWGSNIIDGITGELSTRYNFSFYKLYAPTMMSRGYSQLRGFLYSLYAGIYLNLLNAQTLLISEIGPTMYQPKLSPYDSVTMTTHPFVLDKVKKILRIMLSREFKIAIPFENMTKSEVAAVSPFKEGIPSTHSCISLRFGKSDGTCFGCTIRRLGLLVAGVEDTTYTKDPLGDVNANPDNLLMLMRFSYDILKDYKHMIDSSVDNIENFGKKDLFVRYALDTFAGLYIYQQEVGKLNPKISSLYNEALEEISIQRLQKRITKVRRPTFKPNFSKYV